MRDLIADIDERIAEVQTEMAGYENLQTELYRLKAARLALSKDKPSAAPKKTRTTGRQAQVVRFLQANGPATKKQILEATGMGMTQFYSLTHRSKNVFEKRDGGLFTLVNGQPPATTTPAVSEQPA